MNSEMIVKLKASGRSAVSVHVQLKGDEEYTWLSLTELKSALQKLYRNDKIGSIVWLLEEIGECFEWGKASGPGLRQKIKGCATNILNRMCIMVLGEDSQPYVDDLRVLVKHLLTARLKADGEDYRGMCIALMKYVEVMNNKSRSRFMSCLSAQWRLNRNGDQTEIVSKFDASLIGEIEAFKKPSFTLSTFDKGSPYVTLLGQILNNSKFKANKEIHKYIYGYLVLSEYHDLRPHGEMKGITQICSTPVSLKELVDLGVYDQHVLGKRRGGSVFVDVGCRIVNPSELIVNNMTYVQLEQAYVNDRRGTSDTPVTTTTTSKRVSTTRSHAITDNKYATKEKKELKRVNNKPTIQSLDMFEQIPENKKLLGFKNVTRILKKKDTGDKVFVKCGESEVDNKYASGVQSLLRQLQLESHTSTVVHVSVQDVCMLIESADGDLKSRDSLKLEVDAKTSRLKELKKEKADVTELQSEVSLLEGQLKDAVWKNSTMKVYGHRVKDPAVTRVDKDGNKCMSMLVEDSLCDDYKRVTDVCNSLGDKYICGLPDFASSFVLTWLTALYLGKRDSNMFNCMINATGTVRCVDWCPALDLSNHTSLITAQSVRKAYREAGFNWCTKNSLQILNHIELLESLDIPDEVDCGRNLKKHMSTISPFDEVSKSLLRNGSVNELEVMFKQLVKLI